MQFIKSVGEEYQIGEISIEVVVKNISGIKGNGKKYPISLPFNIKSFGKKIKGRGEGALTFLEENLDFKKWDGENIKL